MSYAAAGLLHNSSLPTPELWRFWRIVVVPSYPKLAIGGLLEGIVPASGRLLKRKEYAARDTPPEIPCTHAFDNMEHSPILRSNP